MISKNNNNINDFTNINDDVNLMGYPITLTSRPLFIQDNNKLIIPVQSADIVDYAEKKLKYNDVNIIKQSIKYTNDDQNPILLFLKLK